jgi:hypothetical protein
MCSQIVACTEETSQSSSDRIHHDLRHFWARSLPPTPEPLSASFSNGLTTPRHKPLSSPSPPSANAPQIAAAPLRARQGPDQVALTSGSWTVARASGAKRISVQPRSRVI